jgi:hypothetical protein
MRTGTLHVLLGFFGALFVASQVNIIVQAGPVAADVFQLQLTASPEAFREILDGWSAEELTRYRSHFAWDSVHPLIYGTLLGLWTQVVHRQRAFSQGALRLCLTLAVAPSVLDYVENAFHLYLEVNRDSINGGTVMVAASAATLKWLCAALACVLLVVTSFRALSGRPVATAGGASAKPGTAKSGAAKPGTAKPGAVKPDTGKAGTGRAAGGRNGGEVVPAQRAGARDRVTAQVAQRPQDPAGKAAPESTGKVATEPAGKSTGKSDTTPTGKADPKSAGASVASDAGTDAGTGRDAGGKATTRKRSGSRRGAGS